MHDIAVFCGRFRPFHSGHLHIIQQALEKAKYAFVIVGSIGQAIDTNNPFTYEQVREMIRGSLSGTELERVFIFGVPDFESNASWVAAVTTLVNNKAEQLDISANSVTLIGYEKDSSSFYLKLFPNWDNVAASPYEVPDHKMDASTIRRLLYNIPKTMTVAGRQESLRPYGLAVYKVDSIIPAGTYAFLREWVTTPEYERMRDEYLFMEEYLAQFPHTPYPRYFTAADACCFHKDSVLLVRRGKMPGEGLWALPGGHLNFDETFMDASVRELVEETGLDATVSTDELRSAICGEKLMDKPKRSTRVRTISVAYCYRITTQEQPIVEGKDDAVEARWWKLKEVTRGMMFEDHFQIIEAFSAQFQNNI